MVFLEVAYDVYLLKHFSYYYVDLKHFLARGNQRNSSQNLKPEKIRENKEN